MPGDISFPRKYLQVQEVPTQSAEDLELMFGRTWKIDFVGGWAGGGVVLFTSSPLLAANPSVLSYPLWEEARGRAGKTGSVAGQLLQTPLPFIFSFQSQVTLKMIWFSWIQRKGWFWLAALFRVTQPAHSLALAVQLSGPQKGCSLHLISLQGVSYFPGGSFPLTKV